MNNESGESIKKITSGAGLIFLGIIVSKLLGYIYRIVVARIGVEEYGLLNLALAIVGIIGILALVGLNEGILRYIPFYLGKNDENRIKGTIISAIKIGIITSLFFGILLFLFSDKIAILFKKDEISFILKLLIIIIPFDMIRSIFFNAFIGFQQIKYFVYSKNIFENVVKICALIIFLYFGLGLIGAVYSYILAILLSFILSFYFLEKKVFSIIKSKIKSVETKKELLSYSWPLVFTGIFMYIISWTDTFMIGYFKNISDVGIYNAALPTAALIYMIPSTIATIFFPIAIQLHSQEKGDILKNMYKTTTKWVFLSNIYLLAFLIIFSKELLTYIFGGEYKVGYFCLIVVSIGYFISFLSKNSEKILLVLGKSKLVFFNFVIAGLLNIILNYILIPIYGINGAAIATCISYILIAVLVWIESYILTKIIPFKKNYIKIIICVGIIVIIFKLIKNYINSIYLLIICFSILLIVYLILLLILKSFEENDIIAVSMLQQKTGLKIRFLNKLIKKFV